MTTNQVGDTPAAKALARSAAAKRGAATRRRQANARQRNAEDQDREGQEHVPWPLAPRKVGPFTDQKPGEDYTGQSTREAAIARHPSNFGPVEEHIHSLHSGDEEVEYDVDWFQVARDIVHGESAGMPLPRTSVRMTIYDNFWCGQCDRWTPLAPKSWGGARCALCGDDFQCQECGFEIDREGNCQRTNVTGEWCLCDGVPAESI